MTKPANKTSIGIFVLGAIALLVVAVVALGSGKLFRKTFKAVCFFEGSVGGLDVGAPVVFNGVRIGSVTDVVIRYNTSDLTTTIPVYIELDPQQVKTIGPRPSPTDFEKDLRLLIDRGLKARLESQSLVTGKFQVALGSYPERPIKLVGADQKYPEIPTIPTTVQEITRRIEQLPLEEIIKEIATSVDGINRVVNSPEIMETIHSLSQASEESKNLIRNLNSHVQPISSEVQQTLRETQKLFHEIDAKAGALTSSVDGAVKDVQKLVQNVDSQVGPLGPSIQRTLASIEKTSNEAGVALRQAQETLTALEGDIGEDSELMYEFKKALKEVGTAGKAIQSLAKGAERQPEAILFGKKK